MNEDITGHKRAAGELLTLAFGTTVAMWAVGYVMRKPEVAAPGWLLAAGFFACLLAGGFMVGRLTEGGWRTGAIVGFIVAALNLLIVAGTLGDDNVSPTALLWVPGTLVVTSLIMALAAMAGGRLVQTTASGKKMLGEAERINWTGWFTIVAVAATALLLLAGGLVTGRAGGLAVPDWPQSFGYNMFLYPLARMTGNIYYEHTHRLVGALVGLTTITLAVHLWMVWTRRWWLWAAPTLGGLMALVALSVVLHFRRPEWVPFLWLAAVAGVAGVGAALRGVRQNVWPFLAALAVLAVCAQGVLGGYRVGLAQSGGGVEHAMIEHETTVSTLLRVAHGVFGQLFFALMVALAVRASRLWQRARWAVASLAPSTDRGLGVALVAAFAVQLLLGAMVRHVHMQPMAHIVVAALLTVLTVAVGVRAWGLYGRTEPAMKRVGIALIALVALQVVLGVASLAVTGIWPNLQGVPWTRVLFTTAHQVNGAALLGVATTLMLLNFRTLYEAEPWLVDEPSGEGLKLAK